MDNVGTPGERLVEAINTSNIDAMHVAIDTIIQGQS
jgi:hypothetical protein